MARIEYIPVVPPGDQALRERAPLRDVLVASGTIFCDPCTTPSRLTRAVRGTEDGSRTHAGRLVLIDLTGAPCEMIRQALNPPSFDVQDSSTEEREVEELTAAAFDAAGRKNAEFFTLRRKKASEFHGELVVILADDPGSRYELPATVPNGQYILPANMDPSLRARDWACVETPAYFSAAILTSLTHLLDHPNEPINVESPPRPILRPPPSPWGDASVVSRLLRNKAYIYPANADEELHAVIGVTRSDLNKKLMARVSAGWLDERSNRKRVLAYALQLAVRAASWTCEGKPFRCTLVLVPDLQAVNTLGGPTRCCLRLCAAPRVDGIGADTPPFTGGQLRFVFDDPRVKAHLELAQADTAFFPVDADTLELGNIHAHRSRSRSRSSRVSYYHRGEMFRTIAAAKGGRIVLHLRAGRVEVYFPRDGRRMGEDAQLVYVGGEWVVEPFRVVVPLLQDFFPSDPHYRLTRRMLGTFLTLFDAQASSIIVFTNTALRPHEPAGATVPTGEDAAAGVRRQSEAGTVFLREQAADGHQHLLGPLRRGVQSGLRRGRRPIKKIDLAAFASIIQSDGAHVIDPAGYLQQVGYEITLPAGETGGGTGRGVAQALSRYVLRPDPSAPNDGVARGFVVQVSADRLLHVFVEGREQS